VSGDEFKRLRARLKMTQEQCAHRLGVTTSAVSRWEANRRAIPEPVARLLALLVELETKQAPKRRRR
jgi:DNA-binding transcriptional regulator YiaG